MFKLVLHADNSHLNAIHQLINNFIITFTLNITI